jgi:long-chain fatty acid transport protein
MTKRLISVRLKLAFNAVAIMLVLLLAAGGALAGGYALSGVGSKAIGMGGAFRGLADDWSAAYWNPAGLTQLEESELNSMLVMLNPRPEYTPDIYHDGIDVGYRNGDLLYPDDKTIFIPDASGFFKLDNFEKYTVGVGIFVPAGFKSKWDLYNPLDQMDIRHTFPLWDHEGSLSVIDIHPTIARSFMDDKLSLGVGLSFLRGSIEYIKPVIIPSPFPMPHENLIIQSELVGDGWGFGANFGTLYKFNDMFQFGLSGKLPGSIEMKGTARQELFVMDNEILKEILLDQTTDPVEEYMIRQLFGTANLVSEPDAVAELDIPGDVGFGFAVKPTDKLTFVGEVDYTYWSKVDSVVVEMDGFDPIGQPAENSTIMFNYENTMRISLGAEYYPFDPLALRFGYYFDPSPVPDETFTPLIPDLGDKNSYNIGAGLHVGSFELSYNYEYIGFEDRVVAEPTDVNGDGSYDNYAGDFKMTLHASHVSLTYRF